MTINNGSNIRVETNINGVAVDNDVWLQTKSYLEHHTNDTNAAELSDKALDVLYNKPTKVAKDKRISKANIKDLKERQITTNEH